MLDAEIVHRLVQLGNAVGEDLLGELTALFLADADVRMDDLRCALTNRDSARVVSSAHDMRGAGANLGATRLASLCERLETLGTSGDLSGGGRLLAALQIELGRVRIALESLTDPRTRAVP